MSSLNDQLIKNFKLSIFDRQSASLAVEWLQGIGMFSIGTNNTRKDLLDVIANKYGYNLVDPGGSLYCIVRQLAWLIGVAAEESFWEWYVRTYGAASAIKEATQAPNISQLLTAVIDKRFGIGSEPIITDLVDVNKLYSAL